MEALLLCALAFGPLAFGAVEAWSLAVLQALVFAALALAILRGAKREGRSQLAPFFVSVVGIAVLGFLQFLHPRPLTQPSAILPFTVAVHRTGPAALLWAAYAALLWCASRALDGRPALRRLAWTVFLVGTAVAVIGLMQGGQGNNAYYGLRPVRQGDPFGPYPNRDHAASLMAMSLCVGLGIFFSLLARQSRERGIGRILEKAALMILVLFFVAVISLGLWQTHSRGGINSLVIALCGIGFLAAGRFQAPWLRRVMRALPVCAAVGYGLFLYLHPYWLGSVFGVPDSSTAYRLSMYRSGLRLLRDFPVFGIGLGAAQSAFPGYQEGVLQGIVEHLHSDWLELAVSAGLVGAVVYTGALLVFLRRMARRWLISPSRELLWLSAGAFAAVLAFALHGFVDFSFQIPANAVVFLSLIALLEGALRLAHLPEEETPEPGNGPGPIAPSRAAAALAAGALLLLAILPAVSRRQSDPDSVCRAAQALLARALQGPPERRAALLRDALSHARNAYAAEPCNPRFRRSVGTILWYLRRPGDGLGLLRTNPSF